MADKKVKTLSDKLYVKIVDDGDGGFYDCSRNHAELVESSGKTLVAEYKLVKKVEYQREVVAVAEVG